MPYRAFATADGWVVVAALGDKFWPPLCAALDIDALATRADLASNAGRTAARHEVDAAVELALARLSTAEALRRLNAAGVPSGPINSVLAGLATPYVQGRGLVADVPVDGGSYRVVQGPLRDGRPARPAPALGEHTEEVMTAVLGPESPDLAALLGR